MDFQHYTIQRFKAGIDLFPRYFQVAERGDLVYLRNVLTGKYLFSGLEKADITVEGEPYDFSKLQDVVFNSSCNCEDETDDSEVKIFDLSLDKTFE